MLGIDYGCQLKKQTSKQMLSKNSIQSIILISILTFSFNNVISQTRFSKGFDEIEVSNKITTHLIFESKITYVDIGSQMFSVKIIDNILKVKCININDWDIQDKTNLSIITEDGQYFSIWVRFKSSPEIKTYLYTKENSYQLDYFNSIKRKQILDEDCKRFVSKNQNARKSYKRNKMNYKVNGVFYHKDKILIRLKIQNSSKINFTTDSIRFLLTTKKRFNFFKLFKKAEAIQYVEMKAQFVCNNTKNIHAESTSTLLFGFDRFFFNQNELLEIRIAENNAGGRRGKIILKNKFFLF